MRKFKTTTQKKLIGMAILFVFVPLFLLWYWVFFLGHKPGTDTMVILAAVAILAAFLYFRYKKQAALAKAGEELPEGEYEEDLPEEEGSEEEELPEGEEEEAEEEETEESEGEEEPEEEAEEKPVKAKAKKPKGKK